MQDHWSTNIFLMKQTILWVEKMVRVNISLRLIISDMIFKKIPGNKQNKIIKNAISMIMRLFFKQHIGKHNIYDSTIETCKINLIKEEFIFKDHVLRIYLTYSNLILQCFNQERKIKKIIHDMYKYY